MLCQRALRSAGHAQKGAFDGGVRAAEVVLNRTTRLRHLLAKVQEEFEPLGRKGIGTVNIVA